ncbi:MAG: Plasmid stabilization system protein [Myxococcaceae bacterium]|nr:Plasmid stabilization system protein [Myxococcaceae bacterium]
MTALRFRAEVADDLSGAWDWYEARKPGLGDESLAAVARCTDRISANPALFATVHRDVRRAVLWRFPFVVFFTSDADSALVIAVLHARRDPNVWQSRA